MVQECDKTLTFYGVSGDKCARGRRLCYGRAIIGAKTPERF